jgi:hypothetical protein
MKVLQEFPVGLQQSSLVIGDGTRVAERFDDRLLPEVIFALISCLNKPLISI